MISITTSDKIHSKFDCIDGSIINGSKRPILFKFVLTVSPRYRINERPKKYNTKN